MPEGTLAQMLFAPFREMRVWFVVAGCVSAVLLIGTLVASSFLPASAHEGGHSFLLGAYASIPLWPWAVNFMFVLARNLIVLLLHYFCCMVGVIVSRDHVPLSGRWERYARLHRPLPKWMGDAALAYALTITLTSIAVQSVEIGFVLADIGAYSGLSHLQIILLTLPHAIPELIGIFLPLGLFLTQSYRRDLRTLRLYINQTLVIGFCLIIVAAFIEALLSPVLFEWAIASR